MALMNVKLCNKNNFKVEDHLFENYAAIVSGSSFPRHAALKFEGSIDDQHCFIVNAAEKDEQLEELTHDKNKCATIVGFGEIFVEAKLMTLGTTATPGGTAPCPVVKYLVVFTDGRQAILTSRLAESGLAIERILF